MIISDNSFNFFFNKKNLFWVEGENVVLESD